MTGYDRITKITLHRGGESRSFSVDALFEDMAKLGATSRGQMLREWEASATRKGDACFYSADALNIYQARWDGGDQG